MSLIFPSYLRTLRHLRSSFQTLQLQSQLDQSASVVAVAGCQGGLKILKTPKPVELRQQRWKSDDRSALRASMPIKDMGTQGERELDVDITSISKESMFPDEDTPNQIFKGIKFSELPICHIKATKNNTILNLCDYHGKEIFKRTCGQEGFKNARRGTNIAAQTTAISLANTVLGMGFSTIRVAIQGLGPGRISSIKGLQMAGMKIIAIADTTPVAFQYRSRAPKARRL